MLSVILLYLPSLIGLVISTWQLFVLYDIARKNKSSATTLTLSILLMSAGVLISWFIVVGMAEALFMHEFPLLDWRIAALPIFWALAVWFINQGLKK